MGLVAMLLNPSRLLLAASTTALVFTPLAAQAQYTGAPSDAPPPSYAAAQDRAAPPPAYRDDRAPYYQGDPQDEAGPPPADLPPPPDYDGTRPPPPPPGYQQATADEAQRDARYAADVEAWSRDNCVKAHNNTATGAVIGGVLGALLGNGLAGWHNRGAGTLAGAALGAAGGAAIGSSSSNDTSPGCPPGFVVRRAATVYTYAEPDYDYAAPGWYRPWVYVGGTWAYRPYPYHAWYYRTYRPFHGYGRPGYGYGRGPWRGRYYR